MEPDFEADSICVNVVRPAVNFGDRVDAEHADILLLHYTGMASEQGALDWLCCQESGVSCHYFVRTSGEVVQLVSEAHRAHHAGVGCWEGHRDINSRSIGIEIANHGHDGGLPDFPKLQMIAVSNLCRDIVSRLNIQPRHVLGHSDIAPKRKQDPGEQFDWGWLYHQQVGHYVEPAKMTAGTFFQRGDTGEPIEALQSMLALYGYEVEVSGEFDDLTHFAVLGFQRHFRPQCVDGIADPSTIATLYSLLKSLPS